MVWLRSQDVLHDFYVPEVRAKMEFVPGEITYFWFTPTFPGNFEILCAEYCGIGHYNMRGQVVVDTASDYEEWLSQQITFADVRTGGPVGVLVEQRPRLSARRVCLSCPSVDRGPSLAHRCVN
mgnify:CR=1 FL=1